MKFQLSVAGKQSIIAVCRDVAGPHVLHGAARSGGRADWDDRPAAEAHICVEIRDGARRLYLGHGGPVSAEDAWKKFCGGQGPSPR
jgi:hypothetical protein